MDELQDRVGRNPEQLFDELARGEIESDPFGEPLCQELREKILSIFDDVPENGRPRKGDRPQPVHIRLLQALVREGSPRW